MTAVIHDRIVEYLKKHILIIYHDSQHGFRRSNPCLTNLIKFFHDISIKYANGKEIDIIYLNFRKAFNLFPYKRSIKNFDLTPYKKVY